MTSTRAKRSWLVWLIPGGMVLLTVGMIVVMAKRPKPPIEDVPPKIANVEVRTIKPVLYEETLNLPGRIIADEEGAVSTELAGKLKKWLVQEGADVERGQVVAELEKESLLAQEEALKAGVASAEQAEKASRQSVELAKLGVKTAERNLASAANALNAASRSNALAKAELERSRKLATKSITSQSSLDQAKNVAIQAELSEANASESKKIAQMAVETARLQLAQAEVNEKIAQARVAETGASLKDLRVAISKADLRSPVSGALDKHLVKAGEVVSPGTVVANVFDTDHVRVRVNVADRYAPFLAKWTLPMQAYVKANLPGAKQALSCQLIIPGLPDLAGGRRAGLEFPAQIARIGQETDPQSNTYEVELRLQNPGGALRKGMLARASITLLEYPNAVVVPMSSIRVTDQGPKCIIVSVRDGKYFAVSKAIDPRSIRKDEVMVTGGIEAGDLLVIAGGKSVLEGEEVNVIRRDGEFLKPAKKAPTEKLGQR